MEREKAQVVQHKAESTDAPDRVGPLHSSAEAPVMGVERRERLIVHWGPVNRKREELARQWEVATSIRWDEPYESRGSSTVL